MKRITQNTFIPGYNQLPSSLRKEFETTPAGKRLNQILEALADNLENIQDSFVHKLSQFSFLKPISQLLFSDPIKQCIAHAKKQINVEVLLSAEYGELIEPELRTDIEQWAQRHHQTLINNAIELHAAILSNIWQPYLPFLKIEQFNTSYIQQQAQQGFFFDTEKYQTALLEHIKNHFLLIKPANFLSESHFSSGKHAHESASCLYESLLRNNNNQEMLKKYANFIFELSDAASFLQATSFATQNEASWFAWFDVFNAFRIAGKVTEIKSMLSKFWEPFNPLFHEYSSLNQEHNVMQQIIRTIMPFLIIAGTVVLVSLLLTSISISETAFIFILLPTLYIGLILATGYVLAKNFLYNAFNSYWHGGPFEVPQYQVNNRMVFSFGTREVAETVRTFYIQEIKNCLEQEKYYKNMPALTKVELKQKEDNFHKLRTLQFEWYDIHDNPKLSTDIIINIASKRLKQEAENLFPDLEKALQDEIPALVKTLGTDIGEALRTTPGEQYNPRFFVKVPSFEKRAKLDHLCAMKEDIDSLKIEC